MITTLAELPKIAYPKFLICGPAFCGKTTLGMYFPKIHVVDLDGKIENALKVHKDKKDAWVTRPLYDNGIPIAEDKQWPAIDKAVTEACLFPDSQTIMIDGLSAIHRALYSWIPQQTTGEPAVTIAGGKYMNRSMYKAYHKLLFALTLKILAVPKIAILTAHVEDYKDDLVGGIYRGLRAAGESADTLPTIFHNCWTVEAKEGKEGTPSERWVRTSPGGYPKMQALGTALDLPETFKWDWNLVRTALLKQGFQC